MRTGSRRRPQVPAGPSKTPAHAVPRILADCADAGTRHAIVLSAGFGAREATAKLSAPIIGAARPCGPRCAMQCAPTVSPGLSREVSGLFLSSPMSPRDLETVKD